MKTLILRAKHFKGADFCDTHNCSIARAAREQFNATYVCEGVNSLNIDGVEYSHKIYSAIRHDWDKFKAFFCSPETIIRKIQLT